MTVTSSHCVKSKFNIADRKVIYDALFRVKTDDRTQHEIDVFSEAQLASPDPVPAYYATYNLRGKTDVNAFAQDISHNRKDEKNASYHLFRVKWSPITGDPLNDQTSQTNPLLKPVERWVEVETILVPAEAGWNKEALPGIGRGADTYGPIQDAAGQEPSTPIMVPKQVIVIVSEKNFATLEEPLAQDITYHNSLNTNTIFAFAPYDGASEGEALYRGATFSRRQYGGGISYFTVQRRVAIQAGGWDYAMVNRGWKYLGPDPKVQTSPPTVLLEATVKDKDGNEVSAASPINLELDGSKTADGDIGTIINWRTSPKLDFGDLDL